MQKINIIDDYLDQDYIAIDIDDEKSEEDDEKQLHIIYKKKKKRNTETNTLGVVLVSSLVLISTLIVDMF